MLIRRYQCLLCYRLCATNDSHKRHTKRAHGLEIFEKKLFGLVSAYAIKIKKTIILNAHSITENPPQPRTECDEKTIALTIECAESMMDSVHEE